MISCWQDWIVQFSRDRHLLHCWLWTCSAQSDPSSGRTSKQTNSAWSWMCIWSYLAVSLCSNKWFKPALPLALWFGNFLGRWCWSVRMNCTNPAPHVTPPTSQAISQHQEAGQAVELNCILSFCCSHSDNQSPSECVHLPIYVLPKHPYSCVKRKTPFHYKLQFFLVTSRLLLKLENKNSNCQCGPCCSIFFSFQIFPWISLSITLFNKAGTVNISFIQM